MTTQHHATDDELILLFYGELRAGRATEVDAHLTTCPPCRAAWADLQETLTLVDRAEAPEPPDGFERRIWARVDAALPARPRWTIGQLVPVTAMAAVVVLVVGTSGVWRADPAPDNPVASSSRQERVLAAALDAHLTQTELLLVELLNAPDGEDRAWAFERQAADDLLASGRLYRVTARETGNAQVVSMLDDLESVLLEVARAPERVERRDWDSLRTRISEQDLLFKVRAASYEMRGPR